MPSAKNLLTYLAPAACAAGLGHLAWQTGLHWNAPSEEFRMLWLAGDFWTQGGNPYTNDFAVAAADQSVWRAAPNWFPLAALASLFDPLTGARVWLLFNAILLLGASALNVAAFRQMAAQSALFGETEFASLLKSLSPLMLFMLHAGFMATTQASGFAIASGGSSLLIYFGASLVLYGLAAKHDVAGAAGVALVMLNPPLALIAVAALALSAFGRRAIVLGGLVSFLMAAPVLAMTPSVDIAAALIASAAQHAQQPANLPAAMTGLRHVLWVMGAPDLGARFFMLLALAAVCAAGLAGRKRMRPLKSIDTFMIAVFAILAIAPLHVGDWALIGLALLYCAALRPPLGAAMLAAAFFIWRAANLPGLAGDAGVLAMSLAAGVLFAAMLWAAFFAPVPKPVRRARPPQSQNLGDNVVLWSTLMKKRRNA